MFFIYVFSLYSFIGESSQSTASQSTGKGSGPGVRFGGGKQDFARMDTERLTCACS